MKFRVFGHINVLSLHRTTLEFTKDISLTKKGDCILGVKADFNLVELLALVKSSSLLEVLITVDDLVEKLNCETNPNFNDAHEIVIRKTDFISKRTLGINSDKAAIDISRELVQKMQNPKAVAEIEIIGK